MPRWAWIRCEVFVRYSRIPTTAIPVATPRRRRNRLPGPVPSSSRNWFSFEERGPYGTELATDVQEHPASHAGNVLGPRRCPPKSVPPEACACPDVVTMGSGPQPPPLDGTPTRNHDGIPPPPTPRSQHAYPTPSPHPAALRVR